jgi:archaellum component FlaC
VSNSCVTVSRLTEKCLGKYLKKLMGRTDIEDALKRLEKLTNEEVRMATAQTLKATHAVNDRVRVVENKVAGVDDRVAHVDETVTGVDERVARVDKRVTGIDERLVNVGDYAKAINDKVAVVIHGAQPSLISQQENIFNSDVPIVEGKDTRVVIQQVADDMDHVKS